MLHLTNLLKLPVDGPAVIPVLQTALPPGVQKWGYLPDTHSEGAAGPGSGSGPGYSEHPGQGCVVRDLLSCLEGPTCGITCLLWGLASPHCCGVQLCALLRP